MFSIRTIGDPESAGVDVTFWFWGHEENFLFVFWGGGSIWGGLYEGVYMRFEGWGLGPESRNHHSLTSTFCMLYFIAFLSSAQLKVTFPKVWNTKTIGNPKI